MEGGVKEQKEQTEQPVAIVGPASALYGARDLPEIGQILRHFGWRPIGPPKPTDNPEHRPSMPEV